jgi:Ni,Fe-hydrogenase III small subunit/Pyruvate/2-oxoacid:ferredoxin oxidoreductase delta subunit
MKNLFEIVNIFTKKANLDFNKISPIQKNARGIPLPIETNFSNCKECKKCEDICPTKAIIVNHKSIQFDFGSCTQCGYCVNDCPESILVNSRFVHVYSLSRDHLKVEFTESGFTPKEEMLEENHHKFQKLTKGKGINYREVAASGNNSVECELNASFNNVFDSEGNQIRSVASPKHADAILYSGPVGEFMQGPLQTAWDCMPEPKALIACGTEAIQGGVFTKGKTPKEPDLFIAGDPPRPDVIISAIRLLMGVFPYNFQKALQERWNELKKK